jgi:hypothetical protein
MSESFRNPVAIPPDILRAAMGGDEGGTEVVPMADLNNPTIDCTFHASYCLQKYNINYTTCLIACEPPLAFINYKKKGVCI